MDRLTHRDDTGRAVFTRYGMQMYCSTQATADCFAELEESIPRWIPVTERLPETPGEYMVAYHPCYWDRVYDEIKVGLDSFRGKTSWAKKKYQRVTHWMPLPQPPKEVDV